jgi:acyl-CoA reductase-like NAD-dependent aldehyde dehydrogenase
VLTDTATYTNLVDGKRVPAASGETYEKRNPWATDEVVGRFPLSDAIDVDAAVTAAARAFESWSRLPFQARAAVVHAAAALVDERAETIAVDMTREMGKPIRESRGEVARAAAILRYFAGEALRPEGELFQQAGGGRVFTTRRPVGVVGLITPWNFPAAIPIWKVAPALAYGNPVVLKAAREAPLTALHLGECLIDAGLPDGVLNVILGPGSSAGAALVDDERVAAISFTGSIATGTAVRNAATIAGKRVQCELGGQNPLIVMADADLPRAAEASFAGAFWSAGQKCTATRRIYVQAPVYEEFRSLFLERIDRGVVGDPADPATEVGPLVSEAEHRGVVEAIEQGKREGGTVITSSEAGPGYLVPPTVFEGVADSAMLSCEEVFGPVTSLYSFETLDEALTRANAVPMGLSASIFTSDLAAADRFSRELDAGILHVNSQTAGAEVHVPFGGIKGSGWGPHEQGRAALEFYTDVITVYQDA